MQLTTILRKVFLEDKILEMKFTSARKLTKTIKIGNISIGGNAPVSIQSMTNTDTRNVDATLKQIYDLEEAGCEIIRLAVPDREAAQALCTIKKATNIPVVADIHFDHELALIAINGGVDKVRINPGNIGSFENVKKVADAANYKGIPIRIGVNTGSVEKELLAKYGAPTAEAMVESALRHGDILEKAGFYNIVYSLKASSVPMTIAAYRLMSVSCDYPLHLGVTEAGTEFSASVKSSIGIGCLLAEGIGDTIRVSVTGDPLVEIKIGREILKSIGLRNDGVDVISCPTCGRCQINIIPIAEEINKRLSGIRKNLKIAIMGCAVNGPGEAKEADIGIAGGKGEALLFKKGKIIRKIPEESIVSELMDEINKILEV